MRRKPIIIMAALALCVSGAWLAMSLAMRQPFAGQTTHDFGEVLLSGSPVKLEHTFHLTNRTKQTIEIKVIKPECGCVIVHAEPRAVEPGSNFELPATFTFNSPSKTVMIMMDLGEAGTQYLTLKVNGRYASRLVTQPQTISVKPNQPAECTLLAEIYNTSQPPGAPTLDVPPGLTAHFDGWQLRHESTDPRVTPSQWQGRVVVNPTTANSLSADASIVIHVQSLGDVTVRLTLDE